MYAVGTGVLLLLYIQLQCRLDSRGLTRRQPAAAAVNAMRMEINGRLEKEGEREGGEGAIDEWKEVGQTARQAGRRQTKQLRLSMALKKALT